MAETQAGDQDRKGDPTPTERGGETTLVDSAARWMDDALKAWTVDDYARVAVLAPLAVEHLGKAVLWRQSPALVVPLAAEAEASLLILTTKPDLGNPKLRTVGLATLLTRLEQLLGGLPIDAKRRQRMVAIRNGAMHVGFPVQSRHVLIDALAVCGALLERLGEDSRAFYGDYYSSARGLLDAQRSEVGHRVAANLARARSHLKDLKERLGEPMFEETTDRLQELAAVALDPNDYGADFWGVDADCPVCGSKGRLFGRVDVEPDVDFDVEPLGGGEYETVPVVGWAVVLFPQAFACHVCRLTLHGPEELGECGLPASVHDVEPTDLGEDFDPALFAEAEYGLSD